MKIFNVVSGILLTVSAIAVIGCNKAQPEPKVSGDESASNADDSQPLTPASSFTEAQAECVDEAGETLGCASNEDCCKGFSCGFDPEKSRVQRYCLPE
jgi:hypothetical protein